MNFEIDGHADPADLDDISLLARHMHPQVTRANTPKLTTLKIALSNSSMRNARNSGVCIFRTSHRTAGTSNCTCFIPHLVQYEIDSRCRPLGALSGQQTLRIHQPRHSSVITWKLIWGDSWSGCGCVLSNEGDFACFTIAAGLRLSEL